MHFEFGTVCLIALVQNRPTNTLSWRIIDFINKQLITQLIIHFFGSHQLLMAASPLKKRELILWWGETQQLPLRQKTESPNSSRSSYRLWQNPQKILRQVNIQSELTRHVASASRLVMQQFSLNVTLDQSWCLSWGNLNFDAESCLAATMLTHIVHVCTMQNCLSNKCLVLLRWDYVLYLEEFLLNS